MAEVVRRIPSDWSDTTEHLAENGRCFLHGVRARIHPDSTSTRYVHIWDNANPTPGTTDPLIVIPIEPFTDKSQGTVTWRYQAGGGYRMATALSWFVAEAFNSALAADNDALDPVVDLFYTPSGTGA